MSTPFKMRQAEVAVATQGELNFIFILFGIWSFITLCRPQDYLPMLAVLRPSLTFGIITIVVYLAYSIDRYSAGINYQLKLFIFLVAIMTLGVPFSSYRSSSLKQVFDYASISLIFFILFYHIGNTVEKLKSLLFLYCCGASIYALYALIFGKIIRERIAFGTMFDPNDIAFFLINFIAFNLIFIKDKSFLKRHIAIVNILLSLLVMFKSGSRGGFVACTAVAAYLLFKNTKTLHFPFIVKTIIISLSLVIFWSFSANTDRYKSLVDVTNDYNVTAESGRLAIWEIGLRMMISNPLTGVGMGRFNEGVGKDRESRGLPSAKWQAPHNSFIQIGAEIGIFGLLLFALMSAKVLRISDKVIVKSQSADLVNISEMARAGFIGHLVSAIFLSQAYSIYWVFYIALSAKLQRMLDKEQI